MPSVQAEQRFARITEILDQEGAVRVADLVDALGVSAVTIRTDLEQLEKQQKLRRTRGGAVPVRTTRFELPLEITSTRMKRQKRAIGRRAAAMVRDGDTVIIDVGGTTTETAKALAPDLRDVMVFTNALNTALELENHPGITVVVTGGTLRPLQHSLVSPFGTLMLRGVNADLAFMGCSGIDPDRGFTNTDLAEAEVKRAIIDAAARTVFVADHTKLLQVATALIAPLKAADRLITDADARPEMLEPVTQRGLRVELASIEEVDGEGLD